VKVMKELEVVKEVDDVKEETRRVGPVKHYTDLLVYRQSHRLALQVSKLTKALPREEQFELVRPLRRCA
jgi:23S rRNA-intervening sequence protein